MSDNELTAIEQRVVDFYDDELLAVQANDGQIYASVRHMCQALEVDDNGQRQRIRRHGILNEGLGVCKIHTPGGQQEARVLRVDLVPLWLSGISTRSIKSAAIREKLERFQREAGRVLWEAFTSGRLTQNQPYTDTPAWIAYRTAKAVTELAWNQVMLEARIEGHEVVLRDHEDRIIDTTQRLETIEAQLDNSGQYITADQQSQVSQAVKAVAIAYGTQTGRNEFGAVYGQIYRYFGISSYQQLPASKFDECMEWLADWLGQWEA